MITSDDRDEDSSPDGRDGGPNGGRSLEDPVVQIAQLIVPPLPSAQQIADELRLVMGRPKTWGQRFIAWLAAFPLPAFIDSYRLARLAVNSRAMRSAASCTSAAHRSDIAASISPNVSR